MATRHHSMCVWGGGIARLFAGAVIIFCAATLLAAEPLFPQPLHLTRRVEDPVSHAATTVHEYCAGNQVVTVAGDLISIADHGTQKLTEIDRASGTYSVTSFADLAAAEAAVTTRPKAAAMSASAKRWTVVRDRDAFAVTFSSSASAASRMDVRLDPKTRLSKGAFEVLIGAAFPHQRSDIHDALFDVAAERNTGDRRVASNSLSPDSSSYALPVDETLTFNVAGDVVTIHSTILDVRAELVPPGTVTIPPGSRLVESHTVRLARELREADQLPAAPSH